ncbi:carboxy terminal-processing peptidase [Nibricoccus aquaticus]|nr:carboxy terminal-processing peptidase [Nibricoccus aquaticus]
MKFSHLRSLTLSLLAFVLAQPALHAAERTYKPDAYFEREVTQLIRLLEEYHYNRDGVKSADYAQIIPDFMAEFDGLRLFFLESDKQDFQKRWPAPWLYNNISNLGRIEPAFEIFRTYEERTTARINWILEELKKDFDLTTKETYLVDRSKSAWPATPEEADALWRKRLTFELIQELLEKKPAPVASTTPAPDASTNAPTPAPTPEVKPAEASSAPVAVASAPVTIDEAKQNIRKRYERRLKTMTDFENHEIGEIFLSSITRLYDPHSTYFSAATFEDFAIQMRLQLVGIGALLGIEDDVCVIKELITGGPADLGKQLRPNDKIMAVSQDGAEPVEVTGMKLRKIVDMIRGKKGTKVSLTIKPAAATDPSERTQIHIIRDVVNLNSARARASIYEVPGASGKTTSLGVITLPAFYGPDGGSDGGDKASATRDVAELINQLKKAGIHGLVLDLRQNGGGLLSEAIDLTGLFIKQGPVVQVKNYYGEVKIDNDEDAAIAYTGPLAVLVSKFSASASEIVAGALQNYGRAIIIGDSSTHGKGSVQQLIEMKNAAPPMMLSRATGKAGAAKLTIQKFYLPDGHSTQLKGVVPDIILPSIEDLLPVGEKDLTRALVWDEIPSSNFEGHPLKSEVVSPLLNASNQRQKTLEEFAYQQKNIDWFRTKQDQKEISINLEDRRQQREADTAFRKLMREEKARLSKDEYASRDFTLGPPKTANIKPELTPEEIADGQETEEDAKKLDIHLREALRVVNDAIELAIKSARTFTDAPPLTAQAVKRS